MINDMITHNCRDEDISKFVTRVADSLDPLSPEFIKANEARYRRIFDEGCNICHGYAIELVRQLGEESDRYKRFHRHLTLLRFQIGDYD